MGTVHISISHDDNLVVAELLDFEFRTDTRTDGVHQVLDFFGVEHAMKACLFDVQNLTADREDGLEFAAAAHLGRTTSGVTLDNKHFAFLRVAATAVGKLARESTAFEDVFAAGEGTGAMRRLAGESCIVDLVQNDSDSCRVFLEEFFELGTECGVHVACNFGVAELALGLAFELRL